MDIQAYKAELRTRMSARRANIPADERQTKETSINARLLQLCAELALAGTDKHEGSRPSLMTYMPMDSEPDITPVMEWCWTKGISVVLPRVIRGTRQLALHEVTAYDQLAPGIWGIREPMPSTPTYSNPGELDVILVPGLAFDCGFGRLGYGGGYYDHLFASLPKQAARRPLLVAAAFDLQLEEEIPLQQHDVRMDRIVTESRDLIVK